MKSVQLLTLALGASGAPVVPALTSPTRTTAPSSVPAAAPVAVPAPASAILAAMSNLEQVTKTGLAGINEALNITQATNGAPAINDTNLGALLFSQNFGSPIAAIQNATKSIAAATTGAAGGIAAQVQNLNQTDLNHLTSAVQSASNVVSSLGAAFDALSSSKVDLAVQDAIRGEVDAVKQSIDGLLAPLVSFAAAARSTQAANGLDTAALRGARQDLMKNIQSQTAAHGIPIAGIPNVSSVAGA